MSHITAESALGTPQLTKSLRLEADILWTVGRTEQSVGVYEKYLESVAAMQQVQEANEDNRYEAFGFLKGGVDDVGGGGRGLRNIFIALRTGSFDTSPRMAGGRRGDVLIRCLLGSFGH